MRRDQSGLYVKTTSVTLNTGWVLNGGSELNYKQATSDITGINGTNEAGAVTMITGNSVILRRFAGEDRVLRAGARLCRRYRDGQGESGVPA